MIKLSKDGYDWVRRERNTANLMRACFRWLKARNLLTADRVYGLIQLTWINNRRGTQDPAPDYEKNTIIPGLQVIFGIHGTYKDIPSLRPHLPPLFRPLLTDEIGFIAYRASMRKKALGWLTQEKGIILGSRS